MNINLRIAAAPLAAFIGAAGFLAAQPVSIAQAVDYGCSNAAVCAYDHAWYGGQSISGARGVCGFEVDLAPTGMNDRISSVADFSGHQQGFFQHSNAGGWKYTVSPWAKVGYVGNDYNDQFSSFIWTG